ncbi:MAG: prolyl oligopeptidase family serine peptidase [Flavobacteriaceae bacterium]|jgi:prolyl oligopeptidase|nr:prolyl oligopeptidase family serine peptidase [Flavobacteriaceae bacterium]
MKKIVYSLTLLAISFANAQYMKYPETQKGEVIDEYFGEKVAAPYRWLEDDRSAETEKWVQEQNAVTFDYLKKNPFREDLKKQITDLWNYEKVSAPFVEGDYTYFFKNDGLLPQSVLYRFKNDDPQKTEEIFLNPNKFSKDGTTSLGDISFSKDGSLAAYQLSEGGSDWRKVVVIETKESIQKYNASNDPDICAIAIKTVFKQIGDTIVDVKFSNIAWLGNDGFFYSSYDKPQEGSQLAGKTEHHKLYYHKLDSLQSSDKLVFGGEETPHRYINGIVSEDERFLIITAANSTSGNNLYAKDLEDEKNDILPIFIFEDFNYNFDFITSNGDDIYIQTNFDAPNGKLIKVPFGCYSGNMMCEVGYFDVISETTEVLNVTTANKFFFAEYIKDVHSEVKQYDLKGKLIREIKLPAIGQAGGFSGKDNQKDIYYSFTNYVYPTTIFKLDTKTGKSELYRKPAIKFNSKDFISKQIFYTSKDGTKIPMTITYKKGLKLDGKNSTILYGYGGFNISLLPSFSVINAVWLQNGGIYAVPNLRGGGEYGRAWHDAGTKQQKLNVFNDFIAAGEYLIQNKYTSSDFLALSGGSNGGLLVGATITIRPDLAKVALPAVGVLDMLRYHTFTAGAGWAYDYGTADDSKEMFEYLKSYSPVHNVKEDVCYPATLITTGDHDDRVVPSHSFKFAAELQEKQSCKNPILIRIETKAGHGAGKSTEQIIEEAADKFAFTLWNMGTGE